MQEYSRRFASEYLPELRREPGVTESIERSAQMKAQCLLGACFTTDTADSYGGIAIHCIMLTMLLYFNNFTFYSAT